MIKIVYCLRKKDELTQQEFLRYWRDEHAALVRRHAEALGIRRYIQSHTISDPRLTATASARGCTGAPYDGVAELWWTSIEELVTFRATDAGRTAGKDLLLDEQKFIDMANSRIFFTEDHVIIPG